MLGVGTALRWVSRLPLPQWKIPHWCTYGALIASAGSEKERYLLGWATRECPVVVSCNHLDLLKRSFFDESESYTSIWIFGIRNHKWARTFSVCLSGSGSPHLIESFQVLSISLQILWFNFSSLLSSIPVCTYHIHSSVEGRLGCLNFLSIVSRAAMNMAEQAL